MCDQLAIAIDTEFGCMYKCGDSVLVEKWAAEKRKTGYTNLVVLTFPRGSEPTEANRCLENSSYAEILLKSILQEEP